MSVNVKSKSNKQCVIYCRVSSYKQSKYLEGHASLETQLLVCTEYATKNNYDVKNVYQDVCSGRNMKKQSNLRKLIRNIEKGDTLIFYEASRFSRNTLEALNCLDKLKKKGVYIYSIVDECSYTNTSDKYKFRILFPKAENESDMISERVKQSILFRRKRGDHIGQAPYGYETFSDEKDGIRKLRKNSDEQFVIEFICKMYYENKTYSEIAEKLNDINIDKRGYTWTNNSVSTVVKSNANNTLLGLKELKSSLKEVIENRPKKKQRKNSYNLRK